MMARTTPTPAPPAPGAATAGNSAPRSASTSRRDEILESAAELFAAHSYEGTSMRDIAQANGVKISTLYSHFSSKAELFDEIVRPLIAEVTTAQLTASETQPGFARLRTMVELVVEACVRDARAMAILHYSWPQLRASSEHTALVAENAAVFARWRATVDIAMADGTMRADLDPHLVTRLLTSTIQGLVDRERYLEHGEVTTARADSLLALIDDVVLTRLEPPRSRRPPRPAAGGTSKATTTTSAGTRRQ